MKYLEKIQILLPLGYLYLILLGLLNESLQYYQLGINILNYSSITDILIRPIAEIFSKPSLTIAIITVCIILFLIQFLLVSFINKNPTRKVFGKVRFTEEATRKEIHKKIFPFIVFFISFEFLSIFVGLGVGSGETIANKLQQNNFTNNYRVSFSSGKTEDVYIFDLNSSYYFYAVKGSKNIHIAPVGTINSLELIYNKNSKLR